MVDLNYDDFRLETDYSIGSGDISNLININGISSYSFGNWFSVYARYATGKETPLNIHMVRGICLEGCLVPEELK